MKKKVKKSASPKENICWGLKILLPKLPVNGVRKTVLSKHVKSKRGRKPKKRTSDKENDMVPLSFGSLIPSVNLYKIESIVNMNPRESLELLKINERDEALLRSKFNKGVTSSITEVSSVKITSVESASSSLTNISTLTTKTCKKAVKENDAIIKTKLRKVTRNGKWTNHDKVSSFGGSAEALTDLVNIESGTTKTSKKRNCSSSSDVENYLKEKRFKSYIENLISSSDSHSCHKDLNEEFQDVEIEQLPDGAVTRKDLVVKVQQHCDTQVTVELSPLRSTTLTSTLKKRESYKKSRKGTKRRVSVQKTTGINLRTRKSGIEKSCIKVIESKYTEVTEKPSRLCAPSIVTRGRSAKQTEVEFYSLPFDKGVLFNVQCDQKTKPNATLSICLSDIMKQNKATLGTCNVSSKKKMNVSFKLNEMENNKETGNVAGSTVGTPESSIVDSHKTPNRICRKRTDERERSDTNVVLSTIQPRCLRNSGKKRVTYYDSDNSSCEFDDDEEKENKNKKLMKKHDANIRTEKFNRKKKSLEDSNKNTGSTKVLSTIHLNTPELSTSRARYKRSLCVSLDRYDYADISSYAITPLREDRIPLPSKTLTDYGIDDIFTDDSTDDEEYPKKEIPEWAKNITRQKDICSYVSPDLVKSWICPPAVKLTVKTTFCY